MTPTPIAATRRNWPRILRTGDINPETLPAADLMIVIAFGQKIADPRCITAAGEVNLHASRLPKFRGAAPINAAILAGETITGNSIIRLAQKRGRRRHGVLILIGELETAGELHDRLAEDWMPLMLVVVSKIAH